MNIDDLLPQAISKPQAEARTWSPQQLAIYEAQSSTPHNLQIEAVAGSGKTTTLVELARRAGGKTLILAFNKSIQMEMAQRAFNSDVFTLNGMGHRILMRHRPGAKLEKWKSYSWLRQNMSPELYEACGKEVVRCVGIAKGLAFGINGPSTVDRFLGLIDSYGMSLPPEYVKPASQIAHKAFLALTSPDLAQEFDFDDQLYVPILEGWTFPAYDTVYVDEAQDLNPIQHLMLKALQGRGARIIAVGDRRQAIYGFRGALTNSMDVLRADFAMSEFPLSTTYRCDQAIVALAQEIVPQISARSNAGLGEVITADEYPEPQAYGDGSLIICRNNAPIFDLALQFLKARLPCRVMSSFLDEMEKFIEAFKANDCATLVERLEAWFQKQKADCEERGAWGKLEGLTDRYEVVNAFAREYKRTSELLSAVRQLSTSTRGPRISTIHKAKGLESERVYLLRYDLLPSPRATSDEARLQEENLRYVAITRAKSQLVILPKETPQ